MFITDVMTLCRGARTTEAHERNDPDPCLVFMVRGSKAVALFEDMKLSEWTKIRSWCSGIAEKLSEAKVFLLDNGEIPEVHGFVPSLNNESIELIRSRQFRLPFDVCWFEFQFKQQTEGFLVERIEDRFWCWRFTRMIARNHDVETGERFQVQIAFGCYAVEFGPGEEETFITLHNEMGHFERLQKVTSKSYLNDVDPMDSAASDMIHAFKLGLYMALAVQSNKRHLSLVKAPVTTNRIRRGKGLPPAPDHYVVRLVDGWSPGSKETHH